jgi:hypothetical protein
MESVGEVEHEGGDDHHDDEERQIHHDHIPELGGVLRTLSTLSAGG